MKLLIQTITIFYMLGWYNVIVGQEQLVISDTSGNTAIEMAPSKKEIVTLNHDNVLSTFLHVNASPSSLNNGVRLLHALNTDAQARVAFRIDSRLNNLSDPVRNSFIEMSSLKNGSLGPILNIDGHTVGLGTATPDTAALLHLNGDTRTLYLSSAEEGSTWQIGIGKSTTTAPGGFFLFDEHVAKFVIMEDGSVGIGSSSAKAALDIQSFRDPISSMENISSYQLSLEQSTGGSAGIAFGNSGVNHVAAAIVSEKIGFTGLSNLTFWTRTNENVGGLTQVMTLKQDGNVGIGTTSAAQKLTVNDGNIAVIGGSFIDDGTTLNVPDYVFDQSYKLLPLKEVEKYIEQHKHLPEIPSKGNIQAWSDLSLQDRDMLMLKKIEELTLHLIDLNRHVEEYEKKIKVLNRKLKRRQRCHK